MAVPSQKINTAWYGYEAGAMHNYYTRTKSTFASVEAANRDEIDPNTIPRDTRLESQFWKFATIPTHAVPRELVPVVQEMREKGMGAPEIMVAVQNLQRQIGGMPRENQRKTRRAYERRHIY